MPRTGTFLFVIKILLLVPTAWWNPNSSAPQILISWLLPLLPASPPFACSLKPSALATLKYHPSVSAGDWFQDWLNPKTQNTEIRRVDYRILWTSGLLSPTVLPAQNFQQLLPTIHTRGPAWLFFSSSLWLHTLKYLFLEHVTSLPQPAWLPMNKKKLNTAS